MREFEEKMNAILEEDYGDNGIPYSIGSRMKDDPDIKLMHTLNIPLLRHLAYKMDYDGIGKYICGVIKQQVDKHDSY